MSQGRSITDVPLPTCTLLLGCTDPPRNAYVCLGLCLGKDAEILPVRPVSGMAMQVGDYWFEWTVEAAYQPIREGPQHWEHIEWW